MFCTQCGGKLLEADRFCSSCGKRTDSPPGDSYKAATPAEPLLRRRLQRVMANKRIGGVCAGFAQYFETDVTVMRVIFIALTLVPPSIGVIAYVIGWIAMPRDNE